MTRLRQETYMCFTSDMARLRPPQYSRYGKIIAPPQYFKNGQIKAPSPPKKNVDACGRWMLERLWMDLRSKSEREWMPNFLAIKS